MNWEALGAVGETIGAVAVLVTLVYLAMQVRLGIQTTKAAAYEDVYRDLQQNLNSIPSVLLTKALADEDLTADEARTLTRWWVLMFRMYENWWKQHQNGILDEDVYSAYNSHMRITLSQPGAMRWWKNGTGVDYIPAFVAYVDHKITEWNLRVNT
jgi:hypothetical protein